MIPVRVKLSGFLSYKDEQEIPFAGSPLWMLAGVNGSGKSSVFDAVTYALFGHHRGGSQNAAELINKESNALAVEFDFTLDRRLYRIKRTLKRGARGNAVGTQQMFRHAGAALGNEDGWEAVPDTNKKADFDAWVHERVGLTYETFTSSVLLLQGKAEKLLDSKPSGRAEVLAGIVDLERYQRLHGKANDKRLALKAQLEVLGNQVTGIPEVGELEYAAAEEAIELAEEARQKAQETIDALQKLADDARRWTDTQTRLTAAKEKLRQAERLLGEAVKIEAAFARLCELKDVLPAVNTVVTVRARLKESEEKTARLQKEREETQTREEQLKHNLEQARRKKANLQKTLAGDEEKLAKAVARLRELSGILQSVKLAEDQEAELKRLTDDLGRLPKDPDAQSRAARDEHDRLADLGRVLPVLDRLAVERAELKQAADREKAERRKAEELLALGKKLRDEFDKLSAAGEAVRQAKAKSDEAAAGTAVLAKQARAAADEFAGLAGEKTCRACGQVLTPAHFEEERKRREWDAKAAEKKHADAVAAQRTAADREAEHRAAEAAAKDRLDKVREDYAGQKDEPKRAAEEAARLVRSLNLIYAGLPDPYRSKVGPAPPDDWTAVAYPARDELSRLRNEAAGLDAAKWKAREAADALDAWKRLTAKAESAKQTLARLRAGLPGDPAAVREEHGSLHAGEQALVNGIKGTKQGVAAADAEIDRFGRDAHAATTSLTEIVGKLHTEDVTRTNCRENIDRAMRGLPAEWQARVEKAGMSESHGWKTEFDDLTAAGTEAKHKQLEQARGGLAALRGDITGLEQEADLFPADARRSPDEVKAMLADARKDHEAADKSFHEARRRKAVLDGHRERRAELGEQFKRTDAEHNRYKVLAELLGKDRLQRHLVRQAERQIVDYANGVLDRLSGGQLFLKLVSTDDGATADKALDLECSNRVTGGSPINVAFLSGSQKFRVAVSLALGIGQYASKQHRPIESVIIDEGFGCLDRQGRQVMIQELQNLRGHLHCILLVSHQEEFADAFPDGYRFELQNGATRVTRFQR